MDGDGTGVLHVLRRRQGQQEREPCAPEFVEGFQPSAFAVGVFSDGFLVVQGGQQSKREPFARVFYNFLGYVCGLGRKEKNLVGIVVVPVGVAEVLDDIGQGIAVFLVCGFLL